MAGPNLNVTDRVPSRIGITEVEIFEAGDLPAPALGRIALTTKTFILKDSVTISDSLVIEPGQTVELTASGFGSTITYTGTGTLFESVSGGFVVIRNINVVLTAPGAQLFDMVSDSLIVSTFLATFAAAGQSIGTADPQIVGASFQNTVMSGFASGFSVLGSTLLQVANTTLNADAGNTGPVMTAASGIAEVDIDNTTFSSGASGSAIEIAAGFTGAATIRGVVINSGSFFSAASLDETDPHVSVAMSPPQKDSFNIGSVIATDNATATVIATQDVFVDLNLNASAAIGSNVELWSLTGATTGELTYVGLSPFNGTLVAALTVASSGGSQQFSFRAVKNGSVLTDGVIAGSEIGNDSVSVSLVVPITAVTGDTIRVQVENNSGTSNITIQQMSLQVS